MKAFLGTHPQHWVPKWSPNSTLGQAVAHEESKLAGGRGSPAHDGNRPTRNAPTVFNSAAHVAQFWDGRAPDVEEQGKEPVLNPVEMAMSSLETIEEVLHGIPGYVAALRYRAGTSS
jgi:cytochrome c peroxidase